MIQAISFTRRTCSNYYKMKLFHKCFLFCIVLGITGFFGLNKVLPIISDYYIYDVTYLSIFFFCISFFVVVILKRRKVNCEVWNIHLSLQLLVLVFFEVFLSSIAYSQNILLTIKEAYYYIIPLFALFVQQQIPTKEQLKMNDFCSIVKKYSIFCSLIAIFAFSLFSIFGINILNLSTGYDNFRNGTIRFSIGNLIVVISLLMCITDILEKKVSKLDIVTIILSLVQLILVSKTRSVILTLLIVFIFGIYFSRKVKIEFKLILSSLAFLIGLFYLINYPVINSKIESYIIADDGIMIRFKTISYYFNQFCQKPLFGMGFISESKNLDTWYLLHGLEGYYYRDDVGFFGLLNEFGLFGALWVIEFLLSMFLLRKKTAGLLIKLYVILLSLQMLNLNFFAPYGLMNIYFLVTISKLKE